MTEISPLKNDEASNGSHNKMKDNDSKDKDSSRRVATGGLRRVFKQRNKHQESRLTTRRHQEEEGSASDGDSEDEKRAAPVTQTTSHHYTLNMPGPAPPPSELPYVLLGHVFLLLSNYYLFIFFRYLQFFFNLSLILIFLYLFVQFIITVQRDVGHRVAEYQQGKFPVLSICFYAITIFMS